MRIYTILTLFVLCNSLSSPSQNPQFVWCKHAKCITFCINFIAYNALTFALPVVSFSHSFSIERKCWKNSFSLHSHCTRSSHFQMPAFDAILSVHWTLTQIQLSHTHRKRERRARAHTNTRPTWTCANAYVFIILKDMSLQITAL